MTAPVLSSVIILDDFSLDFISLQLAWLDEKVLVDRNINEMSDSDEVINIWVASSDGNIERVKALLSEGVDVNAQDESGYSPIHAAASYGHTKLIDYLLSHGANINLKDSEGDSPLMFCEEPDIFEYLISKGADVKQLNNIGESILDKVVQDENENMIGYLISNLYITNDEMQAFITKYQQHEGMNTIDEDEEADAEVDKDES